MEGGPREAIAGGWGISPRHQLSDKRWVEPPASTIEAILGAMGASGRQPPPVPLGESADDPDSACALPAGRMWGWALQLYAARSHASWGIGDLGDLRRLARWSRDQLGAGFLLLNPLHAALPGLPQQPSPYYPSSRQFRNPLYLHVAGKAAHPPTPANESRLVGRLIERDDVYTAKLGALEDAFASFDGDPAFDAYRAEQGAALESYATFCALSEQHGRPWSAWPGGLRHPASPEVEHARRRLRRRVDFHAWLQWQLDVQLAAAGHEIPLVSDVAVGVDPAGADAWMWQDVFAPGMSVGAPPDEFNTRGQDWGVPPFDPWKLRAAGYEPFRQMVRAAFRYAGGIRLDHVMGLFRLYWIPAGASPAEGAYVRYPAADLLDIVAEESRRASAFVVGEDLGTVEDGVRADLAARNILSYRLLWFEQEEPETWPTRAMAAVTTHDLPTVAGLVTGSDLDAQHRIGLHPNEQAMADLRARLRSLAPAAGVPDVVAAAYAAVARSPSMLLTATLDDALGVEERPNMPGTTHEWPDWSIALPLAIEDIESHPGPRRIAEEMNAGIRRRPGTA